MGAETRAEAQRMELEQKCMIDLWRFKKEREHAKTVQFAASLETSIARRQREESEKRESEKRADREHAVGMLKGAHPSRRLRKPAGLPHQHGDTSALMLEFRGTREGDGCGLGQWNDLITAHRGRTNGLRAAWVGDEDTTPARS